MLGKIIILNGVSCVGKTTLAKTIQTLADDLIYRISIDDYFRMIPANKIYSDNGDNIRNAISFMHNSICFLAENKFNVIVDMIYLQKDGDESIIDECRRLFKDYDVVMVKLSCMSQELKSRASQRLDRDFNYIQRQIAMQFPDSAYDIVLDTYKYCPEECAMNVLNFISSGAECTAIKKFKIGNY